MKYLLDLFFTMFFYFKIVLGSNIYGVFQSLTNRDKPDNYATPANSFSSNFNQFFDFDMDNFFDNMHHRYTYEFFRKLQINLE